MSTPEDYCNLHLDIDSVKPQIDAAKLSAELSSSSCKLSSVLSLSAAELTHSNYLHGLIPQRVSSMSTPEDYCNLHLGIDSVKPQIDAVKLSSVLSPSAVELTHSNYLHGLIIIVFTDESFYASQHSRILKSSSRGSSLEDFGSSQFGPSVFSHCC